jgi:hypothetical protein
MGADSALHSEQASCFLNTQGCVTHSCVVGAKKGFLMMWLGVEKFMVKNIYRCLKNKALVSKKFALGPKYANFEAV